MWPSSMLIRMCVRADKPGLGLMNVSITIPVDHSDTAETGLLGEGSMEASDSDTGSEFPANSMSSGISRSDESCPSSTGSATTSRSSVPEVPSDLS